MTQRPNFAINSKNGTDGKNIQGLQLFLSRLWKSRWFKNSRALTLFSLSYLFGFSISSCRRKRFKLWRIIVDIEKAQQNDVSAGKLLFWGFLPSGLKFRAKRIQSRSDHFYRQLKCAKLSNLISRDHLRSHDCFSFECLLAISYCP